MSRPEVYLPDLPEEVISVVGRMLASERLYGTLASLNRSSKAIRYQTNPDLMHSVSARFSHEKDDTHAMSMRQFDDLVMRQFTETYHHIR